MFKCIRLGKLLEEGISLYQQKEFTKANGVFSQALTTSPRDFAAHFWLVRTLTMLSDYVAAREVLLQCRQLKPKVTELLLEPWEGLIYGLENDYILFSNQLDQYNVAADQNLQSCYFKKNYTMRELATVSLLAISAVFIAGIAHHDESYFSVLIAAILMFIIHLCYFHFNTLLPLNLWLRCQWIKEQIGRLAHNSSFIRLNVIIIVCVGVYVLGLMAFIGIFSKSKMYSIETLPNNPIRQPFVWMYTSIIHLLAPAPEELVFRLVWYNYLAKYNKYIAYIGVSFLFMLLHLSMNPVHFLLSFVLIWSYIRYQTLLAPIILHLVYNLSYVIFELLGFKLFLS